MEAAIVRAGYNFNFPMRVGHVASRAMASQINRIMESIQVSGTPNVVLDTVKRGEDDYDVTSTPIRKRDSRNVILRMYEAYGGKGHAKISTYMNYLNGLIIGFFLSKGSLRRIFLKMREMKLN